MIDCLIEDDDLLEKYNTVWDKYIKECKYIEKNVIRHISDTLSDFSASYESDEECLMKNKLELVKLVFQKT